MSSTYYSDDATQVSGQSPTEALAARYRHLFVLPSKATLLVLSAASSILLTVIAAKGFPPLPLIAASVLVALLVPLVIVRTSGVIDPSTVSTFRRSLAVTFAGMLLWLFCAAVGLACSLATGDALALGNSLVFGAFLCGGFEALIISGTFIEQTPVPILLGALQPALTLGAILLEGTTGYSGLAAIPGAAAFVLLVLFTVSLKRKRTSKGHNAVKFFQAFMKTWANRDPAALETIIASHSEIANVASKVIRFQSQGGDLFFVLPGVHPGPFYPVGSYNLPGLISKAFDGSGQVLTLHRPGGHERNLATNAAAKEYARALKEFAVALSPTQPATMRGPITTKIGRATATLSGLAASLLLTVSFAPYGSDDLELEFEKQLAAAASGEGYDVGIVDAHNSMEQVKEKADPNDPQWLKSIQDIKRLNPTEFRIGFAHSQENDFPSSNDITANGISLAVIETLGTKWVLALADANNAVSGLRSTVSTALESSGYKLLEFCTSDSHDLAARGLTVDRGYRALGEATPVDKIARSTVGLARLADSRLASCAFASGTMTSEANLFGAAALGEFAAITRESSAFSKKYAKFCVPSLVALLLLSLVL